MSRPGPDGSTALDAAAQGAGGHELVRRQIPAWLMSLGLHATFFLSIALIVPQLPQGAAEETARTGGIVLVSDNAGPIQYLSEEDAGGALDDGQATGAAMQDSTAGALASQFADAPELLSGLLPRGQESIAGSAETGDGTDKATAMTAGAGVPGPKLGDGHNYATTGVFGLQGRGSKFVYVFDRSGSMDGFQSRPLIAAKRELLQSIAKLDSVHQFQIVFYNERPTILNPDRTATPRLMFGNDDDKGSAQSFAQSIRADGGTKHIEALKLALGMQPHVIFFLTDADEPKLTNAELNEVRRLNDRVGASINAIEFGSGPQNSRESFLQRIARENSGAHVYVDVSQLPRN